MTCSPFTGFTERVRFLGGKKTIQRRLPSVDDWSGRPTEVERWFIRRVVVARRPAPRPMDGKEKRRNTKAPPNRPRVGTCALALPQRPTFSPFFLTFCTLSNCSFIRVSPKMHFHIKWALDQPNQSLGFGSFWMMSWDIKNDVTLSYTIVLDFLKKSCEWNSNAAPVLFSYCTVPWIFKHLKEWKWFDHGISTRVPNFDSKLPLVNLYGFWKSIQYFQNNLIPNYLLEKKSFDLGTGEQTLCFTNHGIPYRSTKLFSD